MKSKKILFFSLAIVLILTIFVSGVSFAYFATQGGTSASQSVQLKTATTDYFKLSISSDLTLSNITQSTMASSATSNPSASATATATLVASDSAAAQTQNYYMYLVADDNEFIYTSGDTSKPELLLKVEYNNGSGNYTEITSSNISSYSGVTLKGLSYKIVNSESSRETSGWDITTATFVEIINSRAINASMNSTTIDNFKLTVIFVNLTDTDQQQNTEKSYTGKIYLQQEAMDEPVLAMYWNDGFSGTTYAKGSTPTTTYASPTQISNLSSYPYYIKTTTEHQACLYGSSTGKEFCFGANYWDTDGSTTKTKLQTAMADSLGISTSSLSCNSNSSVAYCYVGDSSLYCIANSNGDVNCGNNGVGSACRVNSVGGAICFEL